MNVVIIDYQLSNIYSVKHACEAVGLNAILSSDKNDLAKADGAILPGVGAFGDAMKNLNKFDLISPIKDFISKGKPFFGICLGMQLLFSESCEFGKHNGLNIIRGSVVKFPEKNKEGKKIRIPHMGWNKIFYPEGHKSWNNTIFKNIDNEEFVYFVHSYFVIPTDIKYTLSQTCYCGVEYCSGVQMNNVFATQFHPEKSGEVGLKIYRNFAQILKK